MVESWIKSVQPGMTKNCHFLLLLLLLNWVVIFEALFGHYDILVLGKKVQAGKDQENVQSEKDSHSKNRGGKKKQQTNNQVLIS